MRDILDVAWIAKLPLGHTDDLLAELQTASATDAVISSYGNIQFRAGQYQQILYYGQLDTDVMTDFCRLLDKGNNKRHCKVLPLGFYKALTNTNETYWERARNKLSLTAAARYTKEQYIFQYEVILIPIRVGQHWIFLRKDNNFKVTENWHLCA